MNESRLIIRKAKIDDLDELSTLAIQSKAYWGYNKEFVNKCVPILSLHEDDYRITIIYLCVDQSVILGFYQLKEIDETTADLEKLFISPDSIKKGIGSKLFNHARNLAKELGYTKLLIESEPNAKGFYEKQGAEFSFFSISPIDDERKLPNYILDLNNQ